MIEPGAVSAACAASAAELVAEIGGGRIRAAEVVDALTAEIARADGQLMAWETVDAEGAHAAADRIDQARPEISRDARPLLGVPVGIKDVFLTDRIRTTFGSDWFDHQIPRVDAVAVRRLKEAGAVVLGKTVTTAFAGADPARSRNPWHLERTPGGSSSGSAVAVASGMVPIAIGTQTAGSVLRPAAFCGVVGFKPTYGRVPFDGAFPLAPSLDTVGCFARSVVDIEVMLGALLGSPSDDRPAAAANLSGLRAARLGVRAMLTDSVAEHFDAVTAGLTDAGLAVTAAALPFDLDTLWAAQTLIVGAEAAGVHAALVPGFGAGYGPSLRALIELGQLIPGSSYAQALTTMRTFRRLVDHALRDVELLILPTVGESAPDLSTTGNPSLQSIATLLGLPAIALPTGFDEHGLPLSTQLIGRRGADEALLAQARIVESVLGLTWRRPSPREQPSAQVAP